MTRWTITAWALFVFAGCETAVEGSLSETEANRIVVALEAHGIGAEKGRDEHAGSGNQNAFEVLVAHDDVAPALGVMRELDLPQRPDPGLSEVFAQPGLVPTATEERARYTAALSGELSRSIERIDGVLDARVHVALPERTAALDDVAPRPRASVLVKYSAGARAADEQSIRALVAGAVDGMSATDVAVVTVYAPPARASVRPLVQLGPIAVTRTSAGLLKLLLTATLLVNVALAGALLWFLAKQRRLGVATPFPRS